MSDRHIFPTKDGDFNSYVQNVIDYLIEEQVRLRITDADLDDALDLAVKWNSNWNIYSSETLSTKLSQKEKVDLRAKIEVCLRRIYLDLPVSVLTTKDKVTLNIKGQSSKSSTDILIVDFAPGMIGDENEHLYQTLKLQNPKTPKSTAMPHGHWVFLENFVGEAGLKDVDIAFGNGQNVSTAYHATKFASKDLGKTSYYRASYENKTGKRGPVSRTLSVVIW